MTVTYKWTKEKIEELKKAYPDTSNIELAKRFNVTESAIQNQAVKHRFRKSKNHMLTKPGCFKKGMVPKNKGKKMSKEVYEKAKHTMFKKGIQPPNTKYDGHERVDKEGYVLVRVKKCKYVLKHRLVWEQHNGKIPNGMILVFKDKNKNNITIENLELISRSQNMERNSIYRFPPELRETIKLVAKLKRKINEK